MSVVMRHSAHGPGDGDRKARVDLDALAQPCALFDPGLRLNYCNRAYADAVGRPAEELMGEAAGTLFAEYILAERRPLCLRALDTGRAQHEELSYGGRYYRFEAQPHPEGLLLKASDLTDLRPPLEAGSTPAGPGEAK